MKKILVSVLCLCLLVGLTACGDTSPKNNVGGNNAGNNVGDAQKEEVKETALELGIQHSVADYADFTLFKVTTTQKLQAALNGHISYKPQDGEVYVDMILDCTNTGAEAIANDEFVAVTATNDSGIEYNCNTYAVESGSDLDRLTKINPLSETRLHCAISVPENETNLKLKVDVNGSIYTYDYVVGKEESNTKPIKSGETIKAEDFANLVFKGIEYTDDLLPSNTSGVYSHYVIDNASNTYLIVKFDVTNLMGGGRDCDSFVGVKAIYMDKYTYTGNIVVEDEDGKGFGSSYEDIAPLSERHVFCMIEVPKSVTENDVTLVISFDGEEYTYTGK